MIVNLSPAQQERAEIAGKMRYDWARSNGIREAYGCDGRNAIREDQLACLAELAVAVFRDKEDEWIDFSTTFQSIRYDAGDVQVRSTAHPKGRLLLHEKDRDEDQFVLVRTCDKPVMDLVGWINGSEGKNHRFWQSLNKDNRPCFVVPAHLLHDLNTLDV